MLVIGQKMRARLAAMGDAPAYRCGEETLSGLELANRAARLAAFLCKQCPERRPVLLYGHKQPLMPVCILACMLAGVPYVPVDCCTPPLRAAETARIANCGFLLAVTPLALSCPALSAAELERICSAGPILEIFRPVPLDDICYILFTSGSGGIPKGVRITYRNLTHFLGWMSSLPGMQGDGPILNQARFSFDLSVADLHFAFASGRTETVLEWQVQQDFPALFRQLGASGAELAVMTPSFAQYCLLDRSFHSGLLPNLRTFFFCGEALAPNTVEKLFRRFPAVRVLNAYGPTEATVATCAAEITSGHSGMERLPIALGLPAHLHLLNRDKTPVAQGEPGEIVITGAGVGAGYQDEIAGGFTRLQGEPAYCTGDIGVMRDGMLFILGRDDAQIKRGGHRIEPADIEQNLLALPEVARCAVLGLKEPPRVVAYVQPASGYTTTSTRLRDALAERIPPYLLPDRIVILDRKSVV